MSITYQQEFLDTVEKDIKPLIQDHWEEVGFEKECIKTNPDWEAYYALEKAGVLKVFTVRDDGKFLGYMTVFVKTHLHHKAVLCATVDSLFLEKKNRKGYVGIKLIQFVEKCLKEDGVVVFVASCFPQKPLEKILKRLSYKPMENVYSKLLR